MEDWFQLLFRDNKNNLAMKAEMESSSMRILQSNVGRGIVTHWRWIKLA